MAAPPPVQQWEAGVAGALTPLGYGWWSASVSPHVAYTWGSSWSFSWTQPYSWLSDPTSRELRGERGSSALDLGWAIGGPDLRWRLNLGGDLPNSEGSEGGRWRGEAGLSVVRDPVVLGASLGVTVPDKAEYLQGSASLFFQEVSNDHLAWSLVFSPQWTWVEQILFWSVSIAWRVGWYEGPYSVSSGVSSGSGLPWSWSMSATRSWDLR